MLLAAFALADADGGAKAIVDESVVVKPGEAVLWSLPVGKFHLVVNGTKHADKGFVVLAKPGDRLEVSAASRSKNAVRTKAEKQDITVTSQPFTLAVANTENVLERMTVYVKVTADP